MTISIGIYSELAESGRMQHLMTLEQMTSGEVLQAGELEAFGIPCTTTNRISINQMHFRRGQSFSLRFREAAIDLAKKIGRAHV